MPKYADSTQIDSLDSIDMKRFKEWQLLDNHSHSGVLNWLRHGVVQSSVRYSLDQSDDDHFYMELDYRHRRHGEEWESLKYRISMVTTPCNYGAKRWWFQCPVVGCGRRCRILYNWGKYYVCRHCTGCWYQSQCWYDQKFRVLKNIWLSDQLYPQIKRQYYRGMPTRSYRRYLKAQGNHSPEEIIAMHDALFSRL